MVPACTGPAGLGGRKPVQEGAGGPRRRQAPRPPQVLLGPRAGSADVNSGAVGARWPRRLLRPHCPSGSSVSPRAGSTLMGLPLGWGPSSSSGAATLPSTGSEEGRKDAVLLISLSLPICEMGPRSMVQTRGSPLGQFSLGIFGCPNWGGGCTWIRGVGQGCCWVVQRGSEDEEPSGPPG